MSLLDELTRRYYETTAVRGHRPDRAHYENSARGLERRLRPFLPKDKSTPCIDLACGCGELLFGLEQLGYTRTAGADLCAEELEQARPYVRGELVCQDVVAFMRARPSSSAGLITAFNLLEHLDDEPLYTLLCEAYRVLSPGGSLVAMVPNAISPFGQSTRDWDLTHRRAFTPNSMRQLAALTGFGGGVTFFECGPVAHGITSGIRYALWQGMRAAIAGWFLIEVASPRGGVYTMDMLVRFQRNQGA